MALKNLKNLLIVTSIAVAFSVACSNSDENDVINDITSNDNEITNVQPIKSAATPLPLKLSLKKAAEDEKIYPIKQNFKPFYNAFIKELDSRLIKVVTLEDFLRSTKESYDIAVKSNGKIKGIKTSLVLAKGNDEEIILDDQYDVSSMTVREHIYKEDGTLKIYIKFSASEYNYVMADIVQDLGKSSDPIVILDTMETLLKEGQPKSSITCNQACTAPVNHAYGFDPVVR